MATLQDSIDENLRGINKFFGAHGVSELALHVDALKNPAQTPALRVDAAHALRHGYMAAARHTYNGQVRGEALAQAATWQVIADRLGT